MVESQFTLGKHEATLTALMAGQDAIFSRLGRIEKTLAERRGERRVAHIIWATCSGALAALVVSFTKAWLAVHK